MGSKSNLRVSGSTQFFIFKTCKIWGRHCWSAIWGILCWAAKCIWSECWAKCVGSLGRPAQHPHRGYNAERHLWIMPDTSLTGCCKMHLWPRIHFTQRFAVNSHVHSAMNNYTTIWEIYFILFYLFFWRGGGALIIFPGLTLTLKWGHPLSIRYIPSPELLNAWLKQKSKA